MNGIVRTTFKLGCNDSVQVSADGDLRHLRVEDISTAVATVVLPAHIAFDVAFALTPELGARHTQLCEARKALYELSYPDVRARDLRAIASEVDCDDCPHMGRSECSKETRGEFCGGTAANGLRKLADALDVKAKADAERAAELAKQDIAF